MSNTAQAKKRAIQGEKARQRNVSLRSKYRTCIKKVIQAISTGQKIVANEAYKLAVPILDGMTNKKILTKNAAARYKKRLSAKIKSMSS